MFCNSSKQSQHTTRSMMYFYKSKRRYRTTLVNFWPWFKNNYLKRSINLTIQCFSNIQCLESSKIVVDYFINIWCQRKSKSIEFFKLREILKSLHKNTIDSIVIRPSNNLYQAIVKKKKKNIHKTPLSIICVFEAKHPRSRKPGNPNSVTFFFFF